MESDYLNGPLRCLKKKSRTRTFLRRAQKPFVFLAVVLLLNVGIFAAYSSRHVAGGVYLGKDLMAGLTESEVLQVVKKQVGHLAFKEVLLNDGEHKERFSLLDTGLSFDEQGTVMDVFRAGGSVFSQFGAAQLMGTPSALENNEEEISTAIIVEPRFSLDEGALYSFVEEKLKRREFPPRNAELLWNGTTGWSKGEAFYGRRLKDSEVERIVKGIVEGLFDVGKLVTYSAEYELVSPARFAADLDDVMAQVREMELTPLKLQIGEVEEYVYIAASAPDWFTIDYENNSVSVRESYVKTWIEKFSAPYFQEATEVTIVGLKEFDSDYKKGKTYNKAILKDGDVMIRGQQVDEEKMFRDVLIALEDLETREVAVNITSIPVKIHSEVAGISFPDMLGTGGASEYPIDAAHRDRAHNVENAIDLQNLTIIAPGESTSYNTIGGWVTYSTGYVDGEVIFGSVLRKVPGGGVCQSSTTLFRSLFYAGIQVDYSRAHSWRVHYYDDYLGPAGGHQLGLDAAVYPPGGLDVAFTNDTPGYMLVHSWYKSDEGKAFYDIYGTNDGRQVVLDSEMQDTRKGRGSVVVRDYDIVYGDGTVDERERVARYAK